MEKLQNTDRAYWMRMAQQAALKSRCLRSTSQMGAVAVRDGQIIAEGYNGALDSIKTCAERGYCIRQKNNIPSGTNRETAFCICAEQRIICSAAREGKSLKGAEIYVTYFPCAYCVRLMIETGITRVFYKDKYLQPFAQEIADEAGFEIIKIDV